MALPIEVEPLAFPTPAPPRGETAVPKVAVPTPAPVPAVRPVPEPMPARPTAPSAPVERSRPVADVAVGSIASPAEDVDGILRMLERERIFEPPSDEPADWAPHKEVRKLDRTRIGRLVLVAWVLGVGLAAGGYFGWRAWVQHRHQQATTLVAKAQKEGLAGDHKDLVDGERNLRLAQDLYPRDKNGPRVLLFLQAQRALEDGAFEAGYLRPTLARAKRMKVDPTYVHAVEGVLAAADGNPKAARAGIAKALGKGGSDAQILYLAGRVEQQLGGSAAVDHLEKAAHANPRLVAASIALAEARADAGQLDDAVHLLDGVLGRAPHHLRASLWKVFLTADEGEPGAGLARIDQLMKRRKEAAPTDLVLAELTRSRLLRRKGDAEGAAAAIDCAGRAGVSAPRLLALVASEAKAVGKLVEAEMTATRAVRGAPTNADFRKLLASILIARRAGMAALRTLSPLDIQDPDVLRMSAEAALLVGTAKALTAVANALDQYVQDHDDASVEVRALRIRAKVGLGSASTVLADARKLSRDAPGDPVALRAFGEAALATHDVRDARSAFDRLVRAAPENADGFYLLGRAQRLAADADGAETSFRKALSLSSDDTDARIALGYLLLDRGKYADADSMFEELADTGGIASGSSTALIGRLGRVEALLGLGRVDDAKVQMEDVREEDRDTASRPGRFGPPGARRRSSRRRGLAPASGGRVATGRAGRDRVVRRRTLRHGRGGPGSGSVRLSASARPDPSRVPDWTGGDIPSRLEAQAGHGPARQGRRRAPEPCSAPRPGCAHADPAWTRPDREGPSQHGRGARRAPAGDGHSGRAARGLVLPRRGPLGCAFARFPDGLRPLPVGRAQGSLRGSGAAGGAVSDEGLAGRFRLDGRVAVVTGGSRGIGRGIALAFAHAGADVAIASRDEARADEAASLVRDVGRRALAVGCDVTDGDALARVFERTDDALGPCDLFVHCAGVAGGARALETRRTDLTAMMDVHFVAAVEGAQHAARRMAERKGGAILLVTSIWGLGAQPHTLAYGSAKAALAHAVKVLAVEWARDGIRVNGLAPGTVATEMTAPLPEAVRDKLLERVPLRRVATVDEMAGPALFLCSDAASYITGHVLVADGGERAR